MPTFPELRAQIAFGTDPLTDVPDTGYLNLPGTSGAYASSPDAAALDIVGDIELVARVQLTDYSPAAENYIVGKYGTTANQRSYAMSVNITGTIQYRHSANGIAGTTVASTATLASAGIVDNTAYWLKVTHDVDNGAAGTSVRFYWAADQATEPSSWTQLGSTVTTAGVVSLFAGTAPLNIGSINGGSFTPATGRVSRVIIRNGIDGTSVFDMDFASGVAYTGQTTLAESVAGAIVTVNGTATTVLSSGWTDVSAYVRQAAGVDLSRGRTDVLSPDSAGRVSLTLSNRDRRFDSTHASGPYFGMLKPRVRIRLLAVWSSVTYPVFTGFVARWPQGFTNAGKDATVEIDCYDALDWAAAARMSSDPVKTLVESVGTPTFWLRQCEAKNWPSYDGTSPLAVARGSIQPSPSMMPGLTGNQAGFDGSTAMDIRTPSATAMNDATISFWMRLSTTNDSPLFTMYYDQNGGTDSKIQVSGGLLYADSNSGAVLTCDASALQDYLPHHIVFTTDSGVASALYIDGVLQTSSASAGTWRQGSICAEHIYISGPPDTWELGVGGRVAIQDYLLLPVVMTAAQVAELYDLSVGYLIEDSASRLTRYLDDTGWPAAWRDLTTNPKATVGTVTYQNRQLINGMQELEQSEQGRIFAAKDGNLTFHGRYHFAEVTRGAVSQATFSDDGSNFKYVSFGFTEDDEDVRNDVTVSNGSVESRSTDSASIADYGRRSETVNTILSTATQVSDMSDGLLARWKDQAIRILAFTAGVPSDWSTYLGLELGDRITVESTPMATGSQMVKELLVDSIKWSISDQGWWLTLGGSPVPPDVFILDSSLLDGTDTLGF